MFGWELRERRRQAGLTLKQVARAAGTSETNVAAYERGTKTPRRETLDRLLATIDAGAGSTVHTETLLTFPAAAATLRHGLRAGWSTADLLRVVRELRTGFRRLSDEAALSAFFARPSTTGDARWDTMLAANAENLCLRSGRPAPAWSAGHALPTFWFVGTSPGLRAYAFAHTPISMQVRGVLVDPTDLGGGVSSPGEAFLDADRTRQLLVELGAGLDARGLEARLFLVGGAAMALAFSRRRVTRDLDAVFEPKQEIYDEAARVAARHGLPPDWLNDAVNGLLPDRLPVTEGVGSFEAPGIHVGVASAEYLFAMKAMAARQETDGEDLRRLAEILRLRTADEALALVERFYAPARLGPKTQLIIEDLFDASGP